jgi:hypothetical protein
MGRNFKAANGGLQETLKIVSKVFSIPISNTFIERFSSPMENVWTDNRNRRRVEVGKAELCTKVNFDMTCMKFFQFLGRKEQLPLLKCVSSQKKT